MRERVRERLDHMVALREPRRKQRGFFFLLPPLLLLVHARGVWEKLTDTHGS